MADSRVTLVVRTLAHLDTTKPRKVPAMIPTRFRVRPVEVEARQLLGSPDGQAARVVAAWCGGALASTYLEPKLLIPVAGGDRVARHGDWIVRTGHGGFGIVPGDLFATLYEPVTEVGGQAEQQRCGTSNTMPHPSHEYMRMGVLFQCPGVENVAPQA